MNKCILCGNELLTGDIHWEQGLCNQCYKKTEYPEPNCDIIVDKRKLDIREKYIEKLEQENKKLKEQLDIFIQEIKELKENINIKTKALLLVCENAYDIECVCPFRHNKECENCEWSIGHCEDYVYKCMALNYIKKAKESIYEDRNKV